MSIDAAIGIVWDVLKMGFAPIKRGYGYVTSSKSYAQDLQEEVRNLAYEDQRVRNAAEEAGNNLHDIYEWVPEFLASAAKALEDAKDLSDGFEAASKTCCRGIIPDPKCRYQFSRKAKSKTDDIRKLIPKCKDKDISFIGLAPGNVAARYANELRKEVDNLEYEAARVRNAAKEAENNVRNAHEWVEKFLASAEGSLREARGLLGEFEEVSKTGCGGTLADPNCLFQFSRKAKHKTDDIKNLILESRNKEISFSRPAPGNVAVQSTTATASDSSVSTSIEPMEDGLFESRASMIQKVMNALANNSNSVVGVHGMGGVGKSTLLAEVEKRIREERSFDLVAKANVSENPDIKRIQGEIADALGLSDIKDKESVSGRAKLLRERLEKEEREKNKVLIILDNLWEKLDLDKVGIPCGPDNKARGCKLLLTSRDQHVLLREMRCESDSAFLLGELEKEEAKRLFEKMVGSKVQFELEPLVEKALHICAGLPFLILQIAKLFIHTSFSDCDDALKHIWSEETGKVITKMLQLSYDRISDEAKSLLRLCVAFGASEPPLEYLARYGFGLGIFQRVSSMQEARDKLHRLIHTLQATSLLLDGEEDADGFKIHDLAREFVASFASTDRPLLVLKDKNKWETALSEDKLKSCEAICFPFVDTEELPKELVCPELRIFLLFEYNKSFEISDSYFNSMKNLMALVLIGIRLRRSPLPFQLLENLHSLCLEHCSVEDVAILGELKGLQILSLRYSDIQRLPKEIGQLTELRLLDLDNCSELHTIEAGVLGRLTKIEELYMQDSFGKWNALDQTPPTNARLIELNNMKKLRTLYVSISDPSALPKDLDVEKLTKYRIRIGNVWQRSEYKGSMTLELNLGSTSDVHSICELSQEGFPKLQHLQVEDSPSVYSILRGPFLIAFKALETLLLKNMINLEKITNNNISSKSFSSLRVVRVERCNKMEVLFPRSVVRELRQLEEIIVERCELIRGIVEANGDGGKFELPKLRVLKLRDLPNIENFFTTWSASSTSTSNDQVGTQIAFFNGRQVAFPSLEKLYIKGMDNIEMIWDDQVAVDSFSKLNSLYVDKCNKLVNVVPSIVLGQLLSLERLEARSCYSLKVVFKFQPLNPRDEHSVARSPLKELKLFDLPGLKCMWDKELHHQVKFQCLRSVCISQCLSLTSLFPASVARDLSQLEKLKIDTCGIVELIEKEGLEELNSNEEAIEGTSHELKVILSFTSCFQRLKTLDVSYCDRLSNMFTPTMAANLVGLTKLRISKCGLLTEVISDEGGREGHVVAFNQLKYIKLDGLIGLRCFYSGGYTLMLPLLEEVIVTGCPKMKFFSEGPIEASKLGRVQISEEAWFWRGKLNITIQNMFEEMVRIGGVKNMLLSEFSELIGKWHSELNPIKSSWQLESLTVDKCPSFINAIPSRLMLVLENMNTLQVRDCESLEEIFDLEGLEAMENTRVLCSLTTLDLVNLPKLRRLWNKDLQGTMCLNSLSSLTLYKCSNLRHAFIPSMARCLANLRWMAIKECGQMEGVIAKEEGQGSAMEKTTFPELKWLKLECLPNLTSFLLGKNHMLECPKLVELIISHCPKMRSLAWQSLIEIDDGTPSLFTPQVQFPQLESIVLTHMDNLSKIWTNNPLETLTFEHLRKLKAQNCKSLENLFPQWVATSLNQLKKVQVESCGIEEIVANGDDTPHSTTAQVLFLKLTSLVLHDMPRLKSFCPNLPTLNWPFLEELRVTHCDKLNMLSFAASMSKWTQRDDQQDLSSQEAQTIFERDFPNLERLSLFDKDIQMIRDGKFPDYIFGKPKALTLACCHDENAVFPPRFLLERFQNMESLEVFCGSFEDIFLDEEIVDEGKHPVLEGLTELKLSKLHKLKRVWREDYLVSKILQSIVTLEIWDCPGLTTLFPVVTSFKNLAILVVKNSSGLVHLGTASAVTNLVHLIEMTIIGCERMKEVVANDGNGEEKVISLANLERLTLQNMPSLECFTSTTSCILRFPSLYYIGVEECPKMKIFSKGTLSTPMLSDGTLFRYSYKDAQWKGDLNKAIQELSA